MSIGECGVCGRWWSGTSFPSGNKRPDGSIPLDNFVCFRCQEEALPRREWLASRRECAVGSSGRPWDCESADVERGRAERFRSQARRKVEVWQMPAGKGLSA